MSNDLAQWAVSNEQWLSGQSHGFKVTQLVQFPIDLHPFYSIHWTAIAFHRYGYFKIWPWKSKVKVMGGVKGQGHTGGSASISCTSFSCHVNRPNHSKDMTNRMFSKNPQILETIFSANLYMLIILRSIFRHATKQCTVVLGLAAHTLEGYPVMPKHTFGLASRLLYNLESTSISDICMRQVEKAQSFTIKCLLFSPNGPTILMYWGHQIWL